MLILLSKIKQEKAKEWLVNTAFIGFQMGAGGDKMFGQYLESLGLKEKTIIEEQRTSPKDIAILKRLAKERH